MSGALGSAGDPRVLNQADVAVQLGSMVDVLTTLSAARSREAVIDAIRGCVRRAIGADGIAFVVRDDGQSHYLAEDALSPLWTGQKFPLQCCISGLAMISGEPIVIPDVLQDPRVPLAAYEPTFVRSLAMVPVGPDAAIGAYWATTGQPPEDSVATLRVIARAALVALHAIAACPPAPAPPAAPASPVPPAGADAIAAFAHLPVPAWIADADGNVLGYNQAWFECTHGSPDALAAGAGWRSAHDREPLAAAAEAWKQSLKAGLPIEVTTPVRGIDGTVRHFLSRAVPYRDPEGRIVRWFGINNDVTALVEAERRAEDNARLLQSVIDHIPSAVYVKDREGRFTLANRAALEIMGVPFEVIARRDDCAWLDPRQAEALRAVDRAVLGEGRTIEVEEHIGPESEGGRVLLSRKTPLRDAEGRIIGLIGSSVDITDRKRIHLALADREVFLRRVLDQLFAFVGVTALDGTLQFCNAMPLTGGSATADELLGREFSECPWWSHSAATMQVCRDATRAAAAGETFRADVELLLGGDVAVTVDYQAAPLRDDSGEVVSVVHSGVVIEDRLRAGEIQAAVVGELHLRLKSLFSVVVGMTRLVSRNPDATRSITADLNGRIEALARAHDMLTPAGRPDPRRNPQLRDLVRTAIAPHGAERFLLFGDEIPLAHAAVAPLALILHELSTNARKHGALSSPNGQVSIEWRLRGEDLVIEWDELGGPALTAPPATTGLGGSTIDVCAGKHLGGTVARVWRGNGLSLSLVLPQAVVLRKSA